MERNGFEYKNSAILFLFLGTVALSLFLSKIFNISAISLTGLLLTAVGTAIATYSHFYKKNRNIEEQFIQEFENGLNKDIDVSGAEYQRRPLKSINIIMTIGERQPMEKARLAELWDMRIGERQHMMEKAKFFKLILDIAVLYSDIVEKYSDECEQLSVKIKESSGFYVASAEIPSDLAMQFSNEEISMRMYLDKIKQTTELASNNQASMKPPILRF